MDTEIKIVPSKTSVKVGETFDIEVQVTPGLVIGGIAGLQMDIAFNPACMKIDSIAQGPFLGSQRFCSKGEIDNSAGTVKKIFGVVTTPGQGVTSPGSFLVITCQALKQGASNLVLSNVIVGNKEGLSVPFELSVTQVVVLSAYDLDGDGLVDTGDLGIAASQYGVAGSADFNGDGVVNILDIITLVQNFT